MIAGVGLTALSGGTLTPVMAGLLTGGGTALATGNLQKGLMAGLGAYGGAGIGSSLATAGGNALTQEALLKANPGMNAIDIAQNGAGFTLPEMSMTDKMMAGVKGLGSEAGRDMFMQSIGGAKGLFKSGASAALPVIMAGSGETASPPAGSGKNPYEYDFTPGYTGPIRTPGGGIRFFDPRYVLRRAEGGETYADGGNTGMTGESDEYYRYLMGLAPMPTAYVAPVATPVNLSSPDSAALSPSAQMLAASRRLPYHGELGPADPNDGVTPISNMTADQQAEFYAENPTFAAITQALQGLFGMTALGALQKSMVPDFVASRAQAAQGLKPSNYGYNEGLGYYSLGNPNVDQVVAASGTPGIFSAPVGGIGMYATPAGGITGGLGLNPSNTGVGLTTAGANLAKSGYSLTAGPSSGPTGPTGADEDDAAMGAAIADAISSYGSEGETAPGGASFGSDIGYDSGDTGGGNTVGDDVGIKRGGLTALAAFAQGGYNLGDYSDGGRLLRGPGDGVSDSIPASIGNKRPARLADGEFVVPARIVSELGNGSTEAGARKLYAMMDRVQKTRGKTTGKGRVAVNSRSDRYLPA